MDSERLPRAGRLEILGAWLHVWTPPRDTYVPPPPRGRRLVVLVAVIGIPLAAAVTTLALVFAGTRHREAAQARREAAQTAARERARLRLDQAVHRGSGPPVRLSGDAASIRAGQGRLVTAVEAAITRDALDRFRRHQITRVTGTSCKPYAPGAIGAPPPPPLRAQVGRYECLASTGSLVLGTQKQVTSGYPFWVRIFFTSGRFAWCKINPQAGEGVAGTGGQITVPLAPVCDLTH